MRERDLLQQLADNIVEMGAAISRLTPRRHEAQRNARSRKLFDLSCTHTPRIAKLSDAG